MKKRALISVSDKTGIVELAKRVEGMGYEIISTGGTAKLLKENGVSVIPVDELTGFPECLDGRVKTLHPAVHAGILAMRSNPEHMAQLEKLGVNTIDLVVINLYPFRKTIEKPDVALAEAIENIDIGGPTMLRAAAKNYQDVCVLAEPEDYDRALDELEQNGHLSPETALYLSYRVFAHTAQYDALISGYLADKLDIKFPDKLTLTYEKAQGMRYGENPHQGAAFYKELLPDPGTLVLAEQLNGKELSYNNISDTNGALNLLREFDETAVIGVKHGNPCGVGVADTVLDAYKLAYEADPVSIFGGIVVTNRTIDDAAAKEIAKIFLEIVVAPDYTEGALKILKKKKNLRVLRLPSINDKTVSNKMTAKKVRGGLLYQESDEKLFGDGEPFRVVTKRAPTEQEIKDMILAWKIVKHVSSNGIAVAKDNQSLGIGPGQVNRIWAAEQAIERSGEKVKGAALASDAYFPFEDCVLAAAKAGITCIIQPGGSIRDEDSIRACDENNIAMVFTDMRHFRH